MCSMPEFNAEKCRVWKALGYCSFQYMSNMIPIPIQCPSTCNMCSNYMNTASNGCADLEPNCPTWSSLGLCNSIKQKDERLCRKSCKMC